MGTNKRKKTKKKTVKNKNKNKNNNNTKKNILYLPNNTLKEVDEISQLINKNVPNTLKPLVKDESVVASGPNPYVNANAGVSYAPTINQELVSLKSIIRENIPDCNNDLAFELKEPLKIGKNTSSGVKCYPYTTKEGKDILLKNLSANKHININQIVPPKQLLGNCWFNTMFVTLFVSDKGRKFFHFFRQLMIEGIQTNKNPIPEKIRDGFALLNFAIDASLTGNKYAYLLDTNTIIRQIYKSIPDKYKTENGFITNVNDAGNPIRYYEGIIGYLNNNSLQMLRLPYNNDNWKTDIVSNIMKRVHMPHVIILEVYDGPYGTAGISGKATNKPISFSIKGSKYMLDSCVIRDIKQNHFCATITCEKKEMAYDGMSFHSLVPMEWKKNINKDLFWEFDGSVDQGVPLKWNFRHGYHMLIYYRVT